ncbi:ribosome biogenesis GTPase Der [Geochorda subterranea]|uniref:GTPase Der n=1 Tax=Geochorda subterranea TaxID=3109564 RepID=A0ABZ1BJX5_9FIRM|nr:ribosome biogenesis GTPase Der [Limnochorda sp. LNt]WRP13227.1 ribosome biogenesis GTPase Der [Limnochorda sp. LNt]
MSTRDRPSEAPAATSGPTVAIVGRPNVGKSTLFNRLAGRRLAIVHEQPGVTRDRLRAPVRWKGRLFWAVDTGGLVDLQPGADVGGAILRQAAAALEEAAVVLFVVDARAGLLPGDQTLARWLRRLGKPVLVVANKVDSTAVEPAVHEFAALGLGEILPVSAANGRNVGDLLDRVVERLEQAADAVPSLAAETPEAVRVAIVGRPNVGKSSLVNALVGHERVAVHEEAGTTRDAVDVSLEWEGRLVTLVDTAGIRRKARPGAADLEQLAVSRALAALQRCDVAVVVIDAAEGVTFQEARLAGRAASLGRAVVLAVNKWDLIGERAGRPERFTEEVQTAAARLYWAPVYYVSALRGWQVQALLEGAVAAADRRRQRLDPGQLRAVIDRAQAQHPPSGRGRRGVRIVGVRQLDGPPPTLALALRGAAQLPVPYLRYLERHLRRHFDLTGTPVLWVQGPDARPRRA